MDAVTFKAKLTKAFRSLRRQGFIARQNFLCCQTCAGYEATQIAERMTLLGKKVEGCVFYHQQDARQFNEDGTLYLAYGDLKSSKLGKIGRLTKEVGEMVVAALRAEGLEPEWDGDPDRRIFLSLDFDVETVEGVRP
jgi:hypothetical protein